MPAATRLRAPRLAALLLPLLLAMTASGPPSAAAAADDGPRGRDVYLRACAFCHGVELQGRDARWDLSSRSIPPLDSRGKAWRLSDAELAAVVAGGSHAVPLRLSDTIMPPLGERLSAAEIAAVIGYVKDSWSPADRLRQAEATRRATLPPPAMAELGRQIYLAKCAVCHGGAREGQSHRVGEGTSAREVRIPGLRAGGLASLLGDSSLAAIIREGEARHPAPYSAFRMPSLALEEADVRALIAYLRQAWQTERAGGVAR